MSARQQPALTVDYVFLIDTSGSMAGEAGHRNVFPSVRQAIKDFVAAVDPGTTVLVLPFDAHVRDRRHFSITDAASKTAFERYLDGLRADGGSTGVYRSIAAALDEVRQLRARGGDRIVVFHVYTDGDDNVSREWSLERILKHFTLRRGEHDWLFYTELGLPENPGKKKLFDGTAQTRYTQSADVRPITQITTLLPVLDFGNIKTARSASRTQRFDLRNRANLPPGLTLKLSTSFPDLRDRGVLASVSSSAPQPAESVSWQLELVNAESLADGRYAGEIVIEPSDPTVLVVPNRVRVAFAFEEAHTFTVGASVSMADGVLQLGEIPRQGAAPVVEIPVAFSATAVAARDEVVAELQPDPAVALPPEALRLEPAGLIPVSANRLVVRLVSSTSLPKGTYTGTIRFKSNTADIGGADLKALDDGSRALAWTVTVPRAPIPWWVWAATGAVLLGGAGAWTYSRMKPPVIPDLTVDILEPDKQAVTLTGLASATFGAGSELLPKVAGTLQLVPVGRGKELRVLARPIAGEWHVKRQGAKNEQLIIAEEAIFDSDVVRGPGCRFRVSSFSLIRTDEVV